MIYTVFEKHPDLVVFKDADLHVFDGRIWSIGVPPVSAVYWDPPGGSSYLQVHVYEYYSALKSQLQSLQIYTSVCMISSYRIILYPLSRCL